MTDQTNTSIDVPFLHAITIQQILEGAKCGLDSAFPRQGNRDDRRLLLANYDIAKRVLEAAGFERFVGAVAGLYSGSSWMNDETGEVLRVQVREWNLITSDREGA